MVQTIGRNDSSVAAVIRVANAVVRVHNDGRAVEAHDVGVPVGDHAGGVDGFVVEHGAVRLTAAVRRRPRALRIGEASDGGERESDEERE